jgi:hypothetical protein
MSFTNAQDDSERVILSLNRKNLDLESKVADLESKLADALLEKNKAVESLFTRELEMIDMAEKLFPDSIDTNKVEFQEILNNKFVFSRIHCLILCLTVVFQSSDYGNQQVWVEDVAPDSQCCCWNCYKG